MKLDLDRHRWWDHATTELMKPRHRPLDLAQ